MLKNRIKAGLEAGRIIAGVNRQLNDIIGDDLSTLTQLKKFVIQSGGKRVRPLLLYYLCDLQGKANTGSLKLGAILELVHAASLLHDDVIDEADDRRGQPSGRKLFGNKSVVLGGDYLLACGLEALNDFHDARLMSVFTRVIRELSVAELQQMQFAQSRHAGMAQYLHIIAGKTASLFRAAGECAWYYAHGTAAYNKNFSKIAPAQLGHLLGMYFQIRDDVLDYFAPELLSKKGLQDYRNGLVTYPLLLAQTKVRSKKQLAAFLKIVPANRAQNEAEFLNYLKSESIDSECLANLRQLENEIFSLVDSLPSGDAAVQIRAQVQKLQVQLPR